MWDMFRFAGKESSESEASHLSRSPSLELSWRRTCLAWARLHKKGLLGYACNSTTWELKGRGPEVHPHMEFKVGLATGGFLREKLTDVY